MLRSRLFIGFASAAMCAATAIIPVSVVAQDAEKPAEDTGTSEAESKPTPWPPPNTEKHEIKRDEDQKKGLELHTPKTWKKTKPASRLRLAQFEVPAAEGGDPVELAIFSFAGGAGGVQANVDRWIGQFQKEGRKLQIFTGEGHQGLYVLVDIKGTYNMPDGPPILQKTKPLADARMLAVIIGIRWEEPSEEEGQEPVKKSAVYFLKMAGAEKTVTASEDAFRLAFGAAAKDKENPFEVKEEPPAGE